MKSIKNLNEIPLYTLVCDDYSTCINLKSNCGFRLPNNKFLFLLDNVIDHEHKISKNKKKFKIFDENNFKEKGKHDSAFFSFLIYDYDVDFFEMTDLPNYNESQTLYFLVIRTKTNYGFKFLYKIGYMTIHENYWSVYDHDVNNWITYHINDVIAWKELNFSLKNIERYTQF